MEGKGDWTALEIAVQAGGAEVVQQLLKDSRTEVMHASERGSALHLAAVNGNIKLASMLLL